MYNYYAIIRNAFNDNSGYCEAHLKQFVNVFTVFRLENSHIKRFSELRLSNHSRVIIIITVMYGMLKYIILLILARTWLFALFSSNALFISLQNSTLPISTDIFFIQIQATGVANIGIQPYLMSKNYFAVYSKPFFYIVIVY